MTLAQPQMFSLLAHLGTLEVAHLEGHLLERGGYYREGGYVERMPVPLEHLGRDVGGMYAELLAHIVLDERGDVGEVAHGAAHLAGLDSCGSILEAVDVALHLLVPQGPLEAERGDVCVDSVGPADAGSGLELEGALPEHRLELLEVLEQYGVGLLEQVAVGRVHDIGGGESVVHPFLLLVEALAHGTGECHDVVAGLLLYLLDALDLEAGVGAYLLHIFLGHDTEPAPGLGREGLHLEIGAELVLFGPDVAHHLP